MNELTPLERLEALTEIIESINARAAEWEKAAPFYAMETQHFCASDEWQEIWALTHMNMARPNFWQRLCQRLAHWQHLWKTRNAPPPF